MHCLHCRVRDESVCGLLRYVQNGVPADQHRIKAFDGSLIEQLMEHMDGVWKIIMKSIGAGRLVRSEPPIRSADEIVIR